MIRARLLPQVLEIAQSWHGKGMAGIAGKSSRVGLMQAMCAVVAASCIGARVCRVKACPLLRGSLAYRPDVSLVI